LFLFADTVLMSASPMKSSRRLKDAGQSAGKAGWLLLAQAAVIVVAAMIVYLPALHAGFVWDDDLLVVKNPLLLTWSGLAEIWGFGRTADYFPCDCGKFDTRRGNTTNPRALTAGS